MQNTFDFVGKISPCKETENFKPFETRKFDSGWQKETLKFNVSCGSNRHLLEIGVLLAPVLENTTIYTTTKGGQNSDGSKVKGENIQVKFADRTKPDIVESVANFKKFVIDTEFPGRRQNLEHAIDKFKSGEITDEQMEQLGVKTLAECEEALEKSNKKRHEYIFEYDFIEFLNKLIAKPEIKDWNWHVTGNYTLEYNSKDDKWYRKFNPQRIYRAADDAEIKSQGTFGVVFGKEAIDDTDFDETGKIHINGFIGQYLGNPYKKVCYSPMMFTIDGNGDDKAKKKALGFKKIFTFPDECEREYREIGITCDILDGAQVVELSEDMLTDEQKENIEFGLITLDDIKRELGKPVYGDKVQDIVVVGLARGYSGGAKDTEYTEADLGKPVSATDTVVTDIFDEDDDEI